jgi:hypothetical protein
VVASGGGILANWLNGIHKPNDCWENINLSKAWIVRKERSEEKCVDISNGIARNCNHLTI